MPDYTIKEWNEDNFDVNIVPFVAEAYKERKWAFVADYCRFYACYKEGGIYLDTDVETFKRFDQFLNDAFFAGIEYQENAEVFRLSIDASVFGCVKNHPFVKECLDFYKDKSFYLPDGRITGGTVQNVATILGEKHGFIKKNETQELQNGITIYPTGYFCNISNRFSYQSIYSLHYFDGSWTDESSRGRIYKFCRKYDLMHLYRGVEKLKTRL